MSDETFAELAGALVSYHREITTPRVLVSHVRALISQAALAAIAANVPAVVVSASSSSSASSSCSSSSSSSDHATTTDTTTATAVDTHTTVTASDVDGVDVAPSSLDVTRAAEVLSAELLESFAAFLPPNLRPLVTFHEDSSSAASSSSSSSSSLGVQGLEGQGLIGGGGGEGIAVPAPY